MRPLMIVAIAAAVLAGAVLAGAGAAGAQPAAGGAARPSGAVVDDLTVLGRKTVRPPTGFDSAVSNFVIAHAPASPIGNLSRWRAPVCPVTRGLSPAFNDFVTRRILAIAARVGAPRPDACKTTNVLVVFTTAPQKLVDDVRRDHPKLLGYHYVSDEKALATFQGPVKAWHATGTRGWSGAISRDTTDQGCDAETCGVGAGQKGRGDSRLANGLSNEFLFALVVVDSGEVDGQPIGAVADQAAVLALSDTGGRRGCSALPSVLDALDPACPSGAPIEALTAFDEAFLKGLYASDPENLVEVGRSAIARSIKRVIRPPEPSAR